MDTEAYVIYGMIFGFLALWLLFSLAKKLSNTSRFPKRKKSQISEKIVLKNSKNKL